MAQDLTRWQQRIKNIFAAAGVTFSDSELANLTAVKQADPTLNPANLMDVVRNNPTVYRSYAEKYPGMAELINNGHLDTRNAEASFRAQQNQYRIHLQSYGITGEALQRMSSPDSTAAMIKADVSPDEQLARLQIADNLIKTSGDAFSRALSDHYGLSRGDQLAFLLDPQGAGALVKAKADQMIRTATLQTKAYQYGLDLSNEQVDTLAAMDAGNWAQGSFYGQMNAVANADQSMQAAASQVNTDSQLADLEGDTAFNKFDSVKGIFGDQEQQLKSRQRAQRRNDKFAGTSGIGGNSLSVYSNL